MFWFRFAFFEVVRICNGLINKLIEVQTTNAFKRIWELR